MEQQPSDLTLQPEQTAPVEPQWGTAAPKGARQVFSRMVKEGANVPLFLGQTVISALRDLGYNNTTSAICEHVDNAFQWDASEVRVYFYEKGKRDSRKIDVLVLDNGAGMSPNVLRAVTAFGGSLCYDNRETVGKYGMGMKAAALSMGPTLEIYSWQEGAGIYHMVLDTEEISNDRSNVVQLPEPTLVDALPSEIRDILVQPMTFPRKAEEQELFAGSDQDLATNLGPSGTIIYIPDCDRLTYRTAARALAEHATREMARIYRRFLTPERLLYVNNRRVQPFDPTYRMENARHTTVEGLKEKRSRPVRTWTLEIPIEEDSPTTSEVTIKLFLLPIEEWDQLSRKVLKNELHVFENTGISFVRNDREVHMGPLTSIVGKMGTRDSWWRLEIDFHASLDEAMGVAVNKQGVRPKAYVTELIHREIKEELRTVRSRIEEHWSRRATEATTSKIREAEQRATEAESYMSTLLPEPQMMQEELLAYERELRTLATAYKREGETDDEAYDRIKGSKYVTVFKHDEDAPFYRVDYRLRKIVLSINTAHPFFASLYTPLAQIAKRGAAIGASETEEDSSLDPELVKSCSDALISLELFLLSLARTLSEMTINDVDGERQRAFDQLRRQWSLNYAGQLGVR
jgi:histidine kinase/DNA gyrase B/HSP90-like ATPase